MGDADPPAPTTDATPREAPGQRDPAAPVRLGVVGAGALGLRVLAHLALPDVQGAVRVTHVCDPAEGRAEAAAGRFGVARWSRSLERLLEDPAVDAVTIASPIPLHHEQGMAAIRAGKHVHFNKTMALTPEQATELIEAARTAGLHLVASPGEMLRPHNQRVKAMIAEGVIGTVCWAACGAAFGDYHVEEPERQRHRPAREHRPELVLPLARRRPALRHDRVRPARADGHPRAASSA